jgi:hypothetical protein
MVNHMPLRKLHPPPDEAMTRRSLLVLMSITLFGLLLAATGAREEEFSATKSDVANLPVTRSDGTVGRIRPPDNKEVTKLVGYIRDGMAHADRSDRQKQSKGKVRYLIKIRK